MADKCQEQQQQHQQQQLLKAINKEKIWKEKKKTKNTDSYSQPNDDVINSTVFLRHMNLCGNKIIKKNQTKMSKVYLIRWEKLP